MGRAKKNERLLGNKQDQRRDVQAQRRDVQAQRRDVPERGAANVATFQRRSKSNVATLRPNVTTLGSNVATL